MKFFRLGVTVMAYKFISNLQEFQRNFVNRLCPVGWQSCEYDQNQVDADPSIENTCTPPEELNEFATCQQGCAETGIRYGQVNLYLHSGIYK